MSQLETLFKELDKSGDGFLDRSEIEVLLKRSGKEYGPDDVQAIINDADINRDGRISFKEFVDACM